MHVLYVASYYTDEILDDLEYSTHSLAGNNKKRTIISALRENDHEVTVISPITLREGSFSFTPSKRYEHPERDVDILVPSILDVPLLNYLWLVLVTTYFLLREIRGKRPDSVLFYNFLPHTGFPSIVAGYLTDVPVTVEYEDGNFVASDVGKRLCEKVLLLLAKPVLAGGICVNIPLANRLPTNNTGTVRGHPSIGFINRSQIELIDQDTFSVMFAGRFDELRGIYPFLTLARAYAPKCDDIEFWISGYGPDSDDVRREVEEMNQSNVRFFGTLDKDDYVSRLFSADVLVNIQDPRPEISAYTFPSKLLDFMVTGNVIVSTEMSDLPAEFGEEFVFTDFESEAIWATIQEIRAAYPSYRQVRQKAKRRVHEEGSIGHIADTLEEVL